VEDVMRLELRCHSDIDLSQSGMQVEIRNHIARCLRDHPHGDEEVITLAGVEHCFMYVVHDDVVDTVIGPLDYIEQVVNERRQTAQEARPPLPRKEAPPAFEIPQNELAQDRAAAALRGIGAGADGLKGIYSYRLRLRWIASLFIKLDCICDAALLDVLGESSRAKPRQPHRTLGLTIRRFGLWGPSELKARVDILWRRVALLRSNERIAKRAK
jgi:hypothetical protein